MTTTVKVEHVFHGGDEGHIELGNAPHLPAPRLEPVLAQAPTHGLARQALMPGEPDHLTAQQFEGPGGTPGRWLRAGGGDLQGLLLAGELARHAGPWRLGDNRLQATFDETTLGARHRRHAADHPFGNLPIRCPSICSHQDLCTLETVDRLVPPARSALNSSRSHW